MSSAASLTDLTLHEIALRLRRGEFTALELARACIERIQRLDGQINSFIAFDPNLALQQCAQLASPPGADASPIFGIPFAAKDLFATADYPTTAGSRFSFAADLPAGQDSAVIHALRSAGAILLGKLNLHEIALGVTNENPHFGDCCNPWNPARITGGSSGGSAAAVAAGFVPFALGSDTGGSIRIPAALCGVVGLKPSRGRVSLRGVIPLSCNLDHAGPLARTVRDTALVLQAIAGYDAQDPFSENQPVGDYTRLLEAGVRGWRVAVAAGDYFDNPNVVEAEVSAAFEQAAMTFAALGAVVERVAIPFARDAALANGLMTQADGAAFHRQRLAETPEVFGADVRKRLQTGAALPLADYIQARRTQSELRRRFEQFFTGYDLLLTPAAPIAAPERGSADAVERARLLTRFTAPFNLTGLPALAIPCGFTRAGLPVGLQLVARPWAEAQLLQAGHAFQTATDFHLRRPPLH